MTPIEFNIDQIREFVKKDYPSVSARICKSLLAHYDNLLTLRLQESKLRKALEEIDKYLSEEHYENGKPVHRNSIGAFSILHKQAREALSSPLEVDAIEQETLWLKVRENMILGHKPEELMKMYSITRKPSQL